MSFDYSQPCHYWNNRFQEQGREYVAHRQLRNFDKQKEIISEAVKPFLVKKYAQALDFGSGVGRFQNVLWECSEKVYALDYVAGALAELRKNWPQTKTSQYQILPLPLGDNMFDLVWTCTVLQHIVDHESFEATCKELIRVSKPGAHFMMIENVSDDAPHVRPRYAQDYADALQLKLIHTERLSIDHKDSHWLIFGELKCLQSIEHIGNAFAENVPMSRN